MSNQLKHETSPYLLQHADNPVDWYPWGEEALQLARSQNKPILLSIGYAACHWCHVMAHESFEDEATAAVMNEHFINIKVDREERPDLDNIYMSAVTALTGQGGWPMTVALTPEGHPFFGGTYYPPEPRHGMPSFQQVLGGIHNAWQTNRDSILENAQEIAAHLQRDFDLAGQDHVLDPMLLDRAIAQLTQVFDQRDGGFNSAPKFPQPMTIEFLLRVVSETQHPESLHMAEHTLDQMAYGGMYDHIGGGFARYSTDNEWLVPHFEKMLYDNAQLARLYLHAWQLTGNPLYKQVTEETLDWVLQEMTHADGGFYSSLDADSEGVEGKFYVWQKAEIEEALGDGAALFLRYYAVSEDGNWEAANIIHTPRVLAVIAGEFGLDVATAAAQLRTARKTLYAVRAQRVWPGLDDKVLTAWNGLMLAAFAEAGRVLERPDYLAAATKNAEFLYATLRTDAGRLLRTWKAGSAAKYNGYLEDYAYLADGLLALYQTGYDVRWFDWAQELAELMLLHFKDDERGGFFDTSADHEKLLFRPKSIQDNAVPSANAMAARVLIRLGMLTGNTVYSDFAEEMVSALYPMMVEHPTSFGHWLGAAWLLLAEKKEVAICGDPSAEQTVALAAVVWGMFRPNIVLGVGSADSMPLLANRTQINGQPTAYVCQNFTCRLPTVDADTMRELLH